MPDIGPIAVTLETCLPGVEPVYCGKPNKMTFENIVKDHKLEGKESKFVMIGDYIETDIKFGINSGIDTILVLTGVSKEEDIKEEAKPTHVLPTLGHTADVAWLESI